MGNDPSTSGRPPNQTSSPTLGCQTTTCTGTFFTCTLEANKYACEKLQQHGWPAVTFPFDNIRGVHFCVGILLAGRGP